MRNFREKIGREFKKDFGYNYALHDKDYANDNLFYNGRLYQDAECNKDNMCDFKKPNS